MWKSCKTLVMKKKSNWKPDKPIHYGEKEKACTSANVYSVQNQKSEMGTSPSGCIG